MHINLRFRVYVSYFGVGLKAKVHLYAGFIPKTPNSVIATDNPQLSFYPQKKRILDRKGL